MGKLTEAAVTRQGSWQGLPVIGAVKPDARAKCTLIFHVIYGWLPLPVTHDAPDAVVAEAIDNVRV